MALSLLFAGCLHGGDDDDTGVEDTSGGALEGDAGLAADDSDNGTDNDTGNDPDNSTGSDPGNQTGNDTGNGTGLSANLTVSPENGTAPLNVTFFLNGTAPENHTWTLDVDDDGTPEENGTGLPATFNHTYTEEGNHTAVLTVEADGQNVSANVTVMVGGGGGPVDPDGDGPMDEEGLCHRPNAQSAGNYWADYRGSGGVWIYQESNGIDGLQVGGPDESDEFKDCLNPDTLVY